MAQGIAVCKLPRVTLSEESTSEEARAIWLLRLGVGSSSGTKTGLRLVCAVGQGEALT
jgi:hypothetical protein